jgi:probable phosphoglycerate mutase
LKEPYILVFDGGSIGNPGQAYGSVRLNRPGERAGTPRRFDFGRGTNNEAEYRALIEGFKALLETLEAESVNPASVALEVRGDSRLVINQLEGKWKIKSPSMRQLHDEAYELSLRFDSVAYVHQGRSDTIRALGH